MSDNTFYAGMTSAKLRTTLDEHPEMAEWFGESYQEELDRYRDETQHVHAAAQDLDEYCAAEELLEPSDISVDVADYDMSSGRPVSYTP